MSARAPSTVNQLAEQLTPILRTYIGDTAEQNYIIDGQEFSDNDMQTALKLVIDTHRRVDYMPVSRLELIRHAAAELMCMRLVRRVRNHLQYADRPSEVDPLLAEMERHRGVVAVLLGEPPPQEMIDDLLGAERAEE